MDRQKKYPTLTCRSISGTLNGSCDCNGLLIADDLCGGIEEALNPDRMNKLWALTNNNMLTRAKESCKILWIGTRWSIIDPIGVRIETLQNDHTYANHKYKIINLPALNENDESNFEYDYGVGFSTAYFHQRRASFERNGDLASWSAQYMCEPIERDGTLFDIDDMKYYNGTLPESGLVRVLSTCDIAWGGGDYTSMPIAYLYENGDVFIHDVVFNKGDKKVTQPLIVSKIREHGISEIDFERNNGGREYKEGVETIMRENDLSCLLVDHQAYQSTTKGGKEQRIFAHSPEIREFYFLESGHRSAEYSQFMMNLFSFKVLAKNKNDDAPDSLAMLCDKLYGNQKKAKLMVIQRPF